MCEEELNDLLQNNKNALGHCFNNTVSNTHTYKNGEKYLHFFFKKEDCDYIRQFRRTKGANQATYIAEFNIPLKSIIGHIGKGFYDSNHGYEVCNVSIYELALPSSIFKANWLKCFEEVSLQDRFPQAETQPE